MLYARSSEVLRRKKLSQKISLLLGINVLAAAWDAVTTRTAANYFQKPKTLSESQKAAIVEDNDPFKELEKEIENLLLIMIMDPWFNSIGSCFKEYRSSFFQRS